MTCLYKREEEESLERHIIWNLHMRSSFGPLLPKWVNVFRFPFVPALSSHWACHTFLSMEKTEDSQAYSSVSCRYLLFIFLSAPNVTLSHVCILNFWKELFIVMSQLHVGKCKQRVVGKQWSAYHAQIKPQ